MVLRTKASYSDNESEREKYNREISYRAALEGIVLLENQNVLPVKPGKIALYGAGADMTIKGGTGSGEVIERHSVSILEGLRKSEYTVTTMQWIKDYEEIYNKEWKKYGKELMGKAIKLDFAHIMEEPFQFPYGRLITEQDILDSATDTCVYVVSRQAGEGGDRKLHNGDNNLGEIEKENLKRCVNKYKNVILVINVGSSIDMKFLDEIPEIGAVIYLCQQGMEGGHAFADIISGKVSPSGKLTDTWAKKYEDIPFHNEFSYLNGELENE